jgi:hypothetical protein
MTPTLLGRWQTRLFLLATVGVLITLPFALGWWGPESSPVYFWILGYVFLFGLAWDILYDFLQKFMWDHDWPGLFQLIAAIAEGIVLVIVIRTVSLPHVPQSLNLKWFVLHYGAVWLGIYLSSWCIMRLLFPQCRFQGGQLNRWSRE